MNAIDTAAVRDKFRAVQSSLSACYVERDELVEAMLLAVIAKHHVCVVGPPGAAKSATLLTLKRVFTDARFFKRLMSRFSVEDDVFGPRSISAMKADRWERVTCNHASAANFVTLDEIFKSNGSMLNAMLEFLNEREYDGAAVPLWTCVAASNELQEDESLDALWDRFLLRLDVSYVQSETAFEALIAKRPPQFVAPCAISMQEIEAVHAEAMAVSPVLTRAVLAELTRIRRKLVADGVVVSDRRWMQVGDLLRAAAWLDNSPEVEVDHLRALRFALWAKQDEIPKVKAALETLDAGPVAQATAIIDDAVREWEQRPSDEATYVSRQSALAQKIESAHKRVDALVLQGVTKRAAERIARKRVALDEAYGSLKADLARRLLGAGAVS